MKTEIKKITKSKDSRKMDTNLTRNISRRNNKCTEQG